MLDDYHHRMVLRLQTMTHADRLEADERAGRMAHGLWRLGRGAARAVRSVSAAAAARRATIELRRTP
jgi:hypothetical protein